MADPSVKTKKKSEKEPNNLYNTPSEALEAVESQYGLLGYYDSYYDPCNGLGKISEYLKDLGKEVITGDLVDYSQYGSEADYIEDFLKVDPKDERFKNIDCIIFNPPFDLTEKFVDHALRFNKPVLMFNRMSTIESQSRSRKFKSGEWPLFAMYQFGFRVSCTEGVEEKPTASSVPYAWFEIVPRSNGTSLFWITKEK